MSRRQSLLYQLTIGVFAVQAGFALYIGLQGPTTPMPLHWNGDWQVDRWGDRVDFALQTGGLALIGLASAGGMGLGAVRAEAAGDASRGRSLRIGQGIVVFAFTVVGLLIAWAGLGHATVDTGPAVMMGGVSLILLIVGAFVGRVAPNPLIGVRTPWSYKSRLSWDRSNRLAGRLFCLLGLAGLIAAPAASQPAGTYALVGGVLFSALVSVFESWRADPNRQPF